MLDENHTLLLSPIRLLGTPGYAIYLPAASFK